MNDTKYKITIGVLVALNLILALTSFGQTPDKTDISPLPLNKTVEREIKAAEEHFYTIKLKAGEVLRLELEEGQDVNYVFRLIKADDGQTITEADLTTTFGREAITYIASTKESLKVLVKAPEKITNSAAYKLTGTVSKRATDSDKERIKAEELSKKASKLLNDAVNLPVGNRTESYQKAAGLAEEALNIRRKQSDKYWEGWTLDFLGHVYNTLEQYEKAKDYYEQSLLISRELKDRRNEAYKLSNLGNVYENLYQFEKAVQYYEQAVLICREIKDRQGEVEILIRLGSVYPFHLNQPEKTKNYYEQWLAIVREDKDRRSEADALKSLGALHDNIGQNEKALLYFQQSLAISQEIKDYREEADTLKMIGVTYSLFLNQKEKAIKPLEQALIVSRKAKDREIEISVLHVLGVSYELSDSNKAIQYYEQALATNRELNDKKGEFITLGYLSHYYHRLKKYGKALQHYEMAFSIARELKDNNLELDALASIGNLYFELRNYEKAREYYEKAASILPQQRGAVIPGIIYIPDDLGTIYRKLKQYEKAKEYYEKEYERYIKELSPPFFIGFMLKNLADLYKEQKKYEKAREYLEKELAFYRERNERDLEGDALSNFGELYQAQKQYERAREYFEQALAISRESKYPIVELIQTFLLGKLYLEQKQYEKARGYLEQALSKMREANLLQQTNIDMFPAMVDLYEGLKNPELAIFYGKQEVNLYQNVRTEIKSFDKDTQLSFVKDKEPAYRKLADLLISEGRFAEAEAVLDLLKEEEFRNYTVRRSGEIPDTVPYSKAEASVAAKVENLAKLERERSELLSQKEKAALSAEKQSRLDQLAVEIESANRAFRVALNALAKADVSVESKVAEIKTEKNLQRALAQLQKETGSKVVALYTLLGTESFDEADNNGSKAKTKSGWIMLVTPTFRKAYPIDVADLEQTVFQFRETLQSDKYDPKPLAETLYTKLFRQTSAKQKVTLEQDLQTLFAGSKDKTLMWSLDGILRYVPMAALHDGTGYLVEKYRNSLFTKESFLTLTEKDKSKWQALGLGVSEGGKNYSALPGAEKELRDIVREPLATSGVIAGRIKLNKDFAEEETFRLWREGNYPVVHIASHYSFNPTDPTSSFLLTGDGQMTFAEMQDKDNLFGATELLTLSACDTAMIHNGKEAEGFAYLAQNLGAKSVIASLWKISDEGTPELMVRFYKLRAENPQMTKGEAFRQAQVSLLAEQTKDNKPSEAVRRELTRPKEEKSKLSLFVKDEKKPYAHPHYWSSFVLIGNWR